MPSPAAPMPTLHTPRLTLQPARLEDAPHFQQAFDHWEVVRYLVHHVPWPYPEGEAQRYLRDNALPAMADGEEWHWSIRLRSAPDTLIGAACLMDEPDNNRGFWLTPAWQGQGLMSEVCAAINRFWFIDLARPVMRVVKATANEASCRLSRREGMRLVGCSEDLFVCGPLQEQLWEITREEWLAKNGL